ncbi:uncharacterized protein BX664DRAFT_271382 [Halteromyces radiatus]|uniref:uncharacterized protein n=1 Tax=Halteromyces radiatus TaxID=101107 RepID=UPI002220E9D4|nr:uncharacterized protein BX664DRAFT_271382 [Halteromyces radiatus]KAI8098657.1 hypothetical protein BX664DRAFT_271382 [Halteromyces radiatus]
MEGEYTTSNSPRPSLSYPEIDSCILNIESTNLRNRTDFNQETQVERDVLYPHTTDLTTRSQTTIDKESLDNFLHTDDDDDLLSKSDIKLDFLLEASQDKYSRRFSDFGDNIHDPSKVKNKTDRYTYYEASTGSLKNTSLKELLSRSVTDDETVANLLVKSSCWWIDIFAPTDQEMRIISKIFRLHPLTTEDIQAQESREKCEIFQNYMFISFRSFNHDYSSQDYLEAVNFYIIVFKDGVLTFRFQPLPHPHNVRKRIHLLRDYITITPEWINYALIDNVTDSFAPLIQHTELEVDSIDDLVLVLNGSEQTDMLRRIGSCRKMVMQLLRLLGPKADVVRSLIKRYDDKTKEIEFLNKRRQNLQQDKTVINPHVNENNLQHEIILFLGDIQDHIHTMLQNVNHYDLVLGRAHRNYLGQISIELSQAGNNTNEVINRLTFLATLVVPLNLVAGLFGMNVHVPGSEEHDLAWFFWIVMGMGTYVTFMLAFGKRFNFL